MEATFGVVLITCPPEKAETIARVLLEKRAAASVNMVPSVSSLYWWKKKIDSSNETLLVAKTRIDAFEELKKVVKATHPYEVPQIVLLPIVTGNRDYLDWIDKETEHSSEEH